GHGNLLDQVLTTAADLQLRTGHITEAAASLAEARRLLAMSYPLADNPDEAWRYAICDSIGAELAAVQSALGVGEKQLETALPLIAKRWGPNGFHTVLARQRAKFIQEQAARTHS